MNRSESLLQQKVAAIAQAKREDTFLTMSKCPPIDLKARVWLDLIP